MDEEAKSTQPTHKKVTSAVLITAACVVAGVVVSQLKPEKPDLLAGTTPRPESPIATPSSTPVAPATAPTSTKIIVHVTGAVKNAGVFEFAPDDRVKDALIRAGGAWSNADLSGLNLAAKLVDGSQLRVPKIGAIAKAPPAAGQRSRSAAPPRLEGVAPCRWPSRPRTKHPWSRCTRRPQPKPRQEPSPPEVLAPKKHRRPQSPSTRPPQRN